MNILLTGANGYIGQRLIPVLLDQGHTVFCCVRNRQRFEVDHRHERIITIETDFLKPGEEVFPLDIDIAYYLIHSMSAGGDFQNLEAQTAHRFLELITPTRCRQII